MFDVLLIPFPFSHSTCKTFKKHSFDNELSCLYISETHVFTIFMFLLPVLELIVDEFGPRIGFHFCTLHQNYVFGQSCVLYVFRDGVFIDLAKGNLI